jgi:hypothetical protein
MFVSIASLIEAAVSAFLGRGVSFPFAAYVLTVRLEPAVDQINRTSLTWHHVPYHRPTTGVYVSIDSSAAYATGIITAITPAFSATRPANLQDETVPITTSTIDFDLTPPLSTTIPAAVSTTTSAYTDVSSINVSEPEDSSSAA